MVKLLKNNTKEDIFSSVDVLLYEWDKWVTCGENKVGLLPGFYILWNTDRSEIWAHIDLRVKLSGRTRT